MLTARTGQGPRWASCITRTVVLVAVLFGGLPLGQCQDSDDGNSPFMQSMFSNYLMNFTKVFAADISQNLGYCIKDTDKDWNDAFNFSSDMSFVNSCLKEVKGMSSACFFSWP